MSQSSCVHLIDDDEAMRASTALLLEAAGLRVRAFASAQEFLAVARDAAPGCVLTDLRMPGIDGIELLRRLRELRADLPVVMMTGHGDVPTAIRALKGGASDFIEKPFKEKALLDAVGEAIEAGRQVGARKAERAAIVERLATLTPREREVLDALVAGRPNKIIAHDLGMSPRTVEVHRARVMHKAGAKSLSELVRLALAAR